MVEMILLFKAYYFQGQTFPELAKMYKLFVYVTRLQHVQQSLYEQLICHKLYSNYSIEQNNSISFSHGCKKKLCKT